MTDGVSDPQGVKVLLLNWPHGGDVEVVAAVLNFWLTASITFQDSFHRFQEGCGMGTVTLEAKLLEQLSALREEVMCVIFLDLHKAYDALDRSRCLKILEVYSAVPRVCQIPRTY